MTPLTLKAIKRRNKKAVPSSPNTQFESLLCSRDDVRELIAEVERLKAAVVQWRETCRAQLVYATRKKAANKAIRGKKKGGGA